MSSRSQRKSTNPKAKAPEPIITRTKSAQQRRQLKNKEKKTEKPEVTKPVIKSPKVKKTVVRSKPSLPKSPVKETDEVIEIVEYYPNKLKRDIQSKKIMLKPKHNFKVIATTNKRKLATPQKGIKSPSSKHISLKSPKGSKISNRPCSSPEMSVQDMVRIMEETRSLSDEDFMEILTCPSPVWWEDPPDGGFDEDSIHTRSSESSIKTTKETKKRKLTTNAKSTKPNDDIVKIDQNAEQQIVIENKKDEKFVKKKQKLENILGNLKNRSVKPKNEVKEDKKGDDRIQKISESEGEISDLSFNEEEILKNLENMDIPVEESPTESQDPLHYKTEIVEKEIKQEAIEMHDNEITSKNDNVDREILSIGIKPEIKEDLCITSSVFEKISIPASSLFKSNASLEKMNSNTDEKSDEFVIVDSCIKSSLGNDKNSNTLLDVDNSCNFGIKNEKHEENLSKFDKDANSSKPANKNGIVTKKTKDLCEFITVYKIIPDKLKSEDKTENEQKSIERIKLDSVRGKLNDFFKHCKSNVRVKKFESPIPAITLTDVKEEPTDNIKENGDTKIDSEDEKSRLKNCDYCVVKHENGTTEFSCDKCEMAPILPCGLCNFLADTKEVYKNHVSTCKDVARIAWSHNYVINQT